MEFSAPLDSQNRASARSSGRTDGVGLPDRYQSDSHCTMHMGMIAKITSCHINPMKKTSLSSRKEGWKLSSEWSAGFNCQCDLKHTTTKERWR
jgi:hypothetical protein